jgi:hypothetical protein
LGFGLARMVYDELVDSKGKGMSSSTWSSPSVGGGFPSSHPGHMRLCTY